MKSQLINVNSLKAPLSASRRGVGGEVLMFFFILSLTFILYTNPFILKVASAATLQRPPTYNSGLVGYWTFDGKNTLWGSNTTLDSSGSGYTGTMFSMSTSTSPTIGKIGQALNFDGNNQYIRTIGQGVITTGAHTFCAWVNVRLPIQALEMLAFAYPVSFLLDNADVDNDFQVSVSNNDTGTQAKSLDVSPLVWHHICGIRYSDNTATLYVDGSQSGTANQAAGTISAVSTDLYIGTTNAQAWDYNGLLDDYRIYNRALSASEISALYRAGAAKMGVTPSKLGGTLDSGLVGHWTFDGKNTLWGSNTTVDSSGSGNTGTMTNMSTTTSPTIGKIGQGLKFDGSNDYVNLGDLSTTEGVSQLTWSLWVYTRTVQNGDAIFSKMNLFSSGPWQIGMATDCNIGNEFIVYIPASAGGTDGGCIDQVLTNQWQHLVIVFNGNGSNNSQRLKMYLDGVDTPISYLGNLPASTLSSADIAKIGEASPGGSSFDGLIDDVRIYNRALSANEIKQLYNLGGDKIATTPSKAGGTLDSGLVGHWTFDGKNTLWSSNTTLDSSGSGNTGTMTNMSTTTSPTIGKIGQGLKFDGVNDYINAGSATSLDNMSALTISIWAKAKSYGQNSQGFFAGKSDGFQVNGWEFKQTETQGVVKFVVDYDGAANLEVDSAANSLTSSDFGKWVHWVITWNGSATASNVHIYKDGVETPSYFTATNGIGNRTTDAAKSLIIGNNDTSSTNRSFDGSLDEVKVYNRVLSASEVYQLYNMGR